MWRGLRGVVLRMRAQMSTLIAYGGTADAGCSYTLSAVSELLPGCRLGGAVPGGRTRRQRTMPSRSSIGLLRVTLNGEETRRDENVAQDAPQISLHDLMEDRPR